MMLVWGVILDRIGTKLGLGRSRSAWWSRAPAMGTARLRAIRRWASASARVPARASARRRNFPASIKTVAEWFPKSERALATGIFNSGTNIGAIVAPIVVPLARYGWGWQMAFIRTGALGFLWLVVWWPLYRRAVETSARHRGRARLHPRRRRRADHREGAAGAT